MRHLGTVLAAAVVGPISWVLFAAGQDRAVREFADAPDGGVPATNDLVRPVLVLVAAGILLGLIATLRFSPLGALLAGSAYSASYLLLLVSPDVVTTLLDHTVTLGGYQVDLMTPVRTGTSLLVGSLMIVAVGSVHRWRRWPQPAAEEPPALTPDDILPASKQTGRPVGVDGLGLGRPGGTPEPDPVPAAGSSWAGRSDWAGPGSGEPGARSRVSSDWMRQPSP
ncbi:hypothetical protein [Micromonospora sp. NPDC126480]|uniref:hypothetical protein n=1 Tax=Micromonospora sp. NPDC126480 TaxID=3155312 RepID=UPI003329EA8C